jgi:hypothetical protein
MNALGRKPAFLALVLLAATAVVGSAYTLWYEQLQINTTVSTTTLDASIACSPPGENEDAQWSSFLPFSKYPKPNPLKEVGSVVLEEQDGPHLVELTIEDAYPGYAFDCEVHIVNTDPLPWHMESVQIVVEECDENGENCEVLGPPPTSWATSCVGFSCTWGNSGVNPPNYPAGLDTWSPLFAYVTNWQGCQVHQGDEFGLPGSFFVGINQSAKENTVYKVSVVFQVNQWNESAWNGCFQPKPPV